MRLLGQPPFVMLSDPHEVRELFMAPPEVLHPGEGARLLEPVVGSQSVILLDEAPHLEHRRLLLPAFHGERMQRLAGLMQELTERELDSWPTDEPVELHSRLQGLTLEIILRAVFGLDEGPRLDRLREQVPAILEFGDSPMSLLPIAQRVMKGRGRFGRFESDRAQVDEELFALMAERRLEHDDRDDVLTMLLAARHEDGSPMSDSEIRDELLTALVAGHETTASSLAFAYEQLARAPEVQARLADGDDDYLNATINEVLRRRPVLPNPEPRLVKQAITIGGHEYEPGVVLIASAYLIHHDPAIYPNPYAFRPERFLGVKPGTYTWLPFGGGRRRCIGASFALLEMQTVLRASAQRFAVLPAAAAQRPRRRMITLTPGDGGRVILRAVTRKEASPEQEAALSVA
jgi:cytochrome P450